MDWEPRNEKALEILGSSFYLMDQRERAKQVWQRVMELNPEHPVIRVEMAGRSYEGSPDPGEEGYLHVHCLNPEQGIIFSRFERLAYQ